MLPENSLKQLNKLRKETKGKDIGDITAKDEILPNLTYIGNTMDKKVDTYQEFVDKDSKLQTVAFKSKLVNKPLVKENKKQIMENKIEKFNEFENIKEENDPLALYKLQQLHKRRMKEEPKYKEDWDKLNAETDDDDLDIKFIQDKEGKKEPEIDEIEKINKFKDFRVEKDDIEEDEEEKFSLAESAGPDLSNQPKFELLGKEIEPQSNANFGYAAIRDQEIRKIAFFNNFTIDPPTPKERPILNAGQFIDNDEVQGYVNRIEGKDVFIESLEDPLVIKKFSIKDVVKTKKEK